MKYKVRENANKNLMDQIPAIIGFQIIFYIAIWGNAWAYESGISYRIFQVNQDIANSFKWIYIGYPFEICNNLLYSFIPVFIIGVIIIITLTSAGWIIDSIIEREETFV